MSKKTFSSWRKTFLLGVTCSITFWILFLSVFDKYLYNKKNQINETIVASNYICHGNESIALLLISCGRWKLLSLSIDSFEKYNTYKCIEKKIVIDDCNDMEGLNKMRQKYPEYEFYQTTTPHINFSHWNYSNSIRKTAARQVLSMYEGITKYANDFEYIFQTEDDWKFFEYGFIEDSFAILKSDQFLGKELRKNRKNDRKYISMVTLRNVQRDDSGLHHTEFCGGHFHYQHIHKLYNISSNIDGVQAYHSNLQYFLNLATKYGAWGHWNANPGLKRIFELKQFIKQCLTDWMNQKRQIKNIEECISEQYMLNGYTIGHSNVYNGYVGHLGTYAHIIENDGDDFDFKMQKSSKPKNMNASYWFDVVNVNKFWKINQSNCQYIKVNITINTTKVNIKNIKANPTKFCPIWGQHYGENIKNKKIKCASASMCNLRCLQHNQNKINHEDACNGWTYSEYLRQCFLKKKYDLMNIYHVDRINPLWISGPVNCSFYGSIIELISNHIHKEKKNGKNKK